MEAEGGRAGAPVLGRDEQGRSARVEGQGEGCGLAETRGEDRAVGGGTQTQDS